MGVTDDADRRSGRRAAATVQALRRLGVAATELTELDAEPALLVLPEGVAVPQAAASTTVVRVRPAPSDEDDDLQQVLARIPAPALTHARRRLEEEGPAAEAHPGARGEPVGAA